MKKIQSFLSIAMSLSLALTMFLGIKLTAFAESGRVKPADYTIPFYANVSTNTDIIGYAKQAEKVSADVSDGTVSAWIVHLWFCIEETETLGLTSENDYMLLFADSNGKLYPWGEAGDYTAVYDTFEYIADPTLTISEAEALMHEEAHWAGIGAPENNSFVLYGYSSGGTDPDPEPKGNYLTPLDKKFEAAITSGNTDTVYWDEGNALPNYIMKLLYENPTLSLDFKFTYEGVEHEVFIGPGQATNDDIEWYGPLWLLEQYGEKKDLPVIHGVYIIEKGDTLNKLAKKFNTTVEELMRLNPYIKDKNKIYPGNTLNY